MGTCRQCGFMVCRWPQWMPVEARRTAANAGSATQICRITDAENKKLAHTRLPSVGFRSWSRFFAVSLQVMWVINPAVGCHYFPPGLQLPLQPLTHLCLLFHKWNIELNNELATRPVFYTAEVCIFLFLRIFTYNLIGVILCWLINKNFVDIFL